MVGMAMWRGWMWVSLVIALLLFACVSEHPASIEVLGPSWAFEWHPVALSVKVRDSKGKLIEGVAVKYDSSNWAILDVSPGGMMECHRIGDAEVRVKAGHIEQSLSVECIDWKVGAMLGQSFGRAK